jgi:predicted  nucleic acid-binding Zn-ribbon protein
MTSSKPKLTNLICLRLNEGTVAAIQKSGQNTSDWLRQAAQARIDQERGKEPALGKLEKQVDSLQKEIARLQQSEAITQVELADIGKALVANRNHQATLEANQVELQRTLLAVENSINNTLVALGPTLLAAIHQQIDQHAQAALDVAKAKEERLRALVPPAPPRTRL